MKYYDKINNRLIFIQNRAEEEFWEKHWQKYDVEKVITSASSSRFLLGYTRKYLPPDSRILEGGCGLGQYVYCLHVNGYDAYGIDYAQKTVGQINEAIPELKVLVGDVRALPFEEGFFDGYWSLGIIEHFYEGFDVIALEMRRVIKSGGYLFLTFPYLSNLRKKKIDKNKYELWRSSPELVANFYQFALSGDSVCKVFLDLGFELISRKPINGLKGFKDEIGVEALRRLLQKVYDSTSFPGRILAYGLDHILSPLAGHCEMMVFRRLDLVKL
jgi:SAM-dependent methyltransferase